MGFQLQLQQPCANTCRDTLPFALPVCCSASYKNKENVDLSKVPAFAQHEKDVGSTEVQIARLTARVEQISSHLKTNRKDYSGQRGLQQVLSQRKKLLQYLFKSNRWGGREAVGRVVEWAWWQRRGTAGAG